MEDTTSGYDTNFIGDVPTYLKCIICQLVLKDPVMLVECGHRFCKACFNAMKLNVAENAQLCCPHDRMQVDQNKVVDDKGISRVVLDLQVKCDNYIHGCLWTGDLRNLHLHINNDCTFKDKLKYVEHVKQLEEKTNTRLTQFEEKLDIWETSMQKRDVEYSAIKDMHQQRNEEIAILKEELQHLNTKMESEVSLLVLQVQNSNKQLIETKMEIVSLKQKLQNMNIYQDHIIPNTISIKQEPMEFSDYNDFVTTAVTKDVVPDSNFSNTIKIEDDWDDSYLKEISVGYYGETILANNQSIQNNQSDKVNFSEVYEDSLMSNNNQSFQNNQSDKSNFSEIYEEPLISNNNLSFQNNLSDNRNFSEISEEPLIPSNENTSKELVGKISEGVRYLQKQMTMIEQLLANKKTIFKWALQDYTFHQELGDAVFSPTFYGSVDAHWCRLWVRWGKRGLDLSFELCTGSSTLKKFRMKVDLEMIDKYGIKERNTIPSSYFKNSKLGYSFQNFIKEPRLKDFIVKDCLFITCILSPE